MTSAVRARRPPMDARIRQRRREVARARARRRRRWTLSALVVALVAAAGVGLSYTPLFAVSEVRVTGAGEPRASQVRGVAGVTEGERLLDVDLAAVAAQVETLPWVRSVAVSRQAPSTVAIAVAAREPVAVLRTQGQAWLIDAEGVLVGGGSADDLARIDAPHAALPGSGAEVGDPAVRNALAVHQALPGPIRALVVRYDAPTETGLRALLHPDLVDAAAEDGLWVRIGAADRVEAKARVIGLLLTELDELDLDQPVAEIDVRAPDNPVIVPRAR